MGKKINRREFLWVSALATAGAASGVYFPTGGAFRALAATSTKFQEAPMLADLVKQGKLPALVARMPIPDDVLVVKPIEMVGQYGGTWHLAWKGPADFHAYGRENYDPVLRWPRNPKDPIQPGLAKRWQFSDDGKTLTLFFRRGLRWSDGKLWTVDDIIFWWEDIETNKELTAAPHAEWVVNGTPMTLEKVDDSTIRLKFAGPNGLVLQELAFHGNQWPLNFERFGFFAPAHYLKQFHPKYNKDIKDYKLFNDKADDLNPERPAMTPWPVSQYRPGDAKLIAIRNPYYWKVDPEGQQLPYIDRLELTLVENNEAVATQALSCQIDMQYRNMDLKKFPLFVSKAKECDYRVIKWLSANGSQVFLWPNQSYAGDPVLRKIFQDRNFRIGLSLAIDRKKINSVAYLDQGVINAPTVVPDSAYYVPGVAKLYQDYNPKQAAEYLDKAGLKLGPDGKVRLRPDRKPLEVTIETSLTGADLDTVQLVAADWEAVGVKAAVKTISRDLYWPRATGNEVQIATPVAGGDRGLEPFVDPIYIFPFDERSWMAPAFGTYYKTNGQKGEKPVGVLAEMQKLFDQFKSTIDRSKQVAIGKRLVQMAVEECTTLSTVGSTPVPLIVKNNFRNVPEHYTQDWIIMSPGNLDTAQFFFKKP
jgi:peptide/nickel transport system substrate-binding protein